MVSNAATRAPEERVLLTSRFRCEHHRVLWGRARLYPDRIELIEIRWTGVRRRTILLRDVERISWRTDTQRTANISIYRHNDSPARFWIQGAGLWKYQIDACLGNRLSIADDLPGSISPAASA